LDVIPFSEVVFFFNNNQQTMKILAILTLLCCLMLSGAPLYANDSSPADLMVAVDSDDVLEGIEARITTALNNSFMKWDISYLENIRAEIAGVETPEHQRLVTYWTAYTDFNIAIFKLKGRQAEAATGILKDAIVSLNALDEMDDEELSLLAHLQDFYVQFVPEDQRKELSASAAANVDLALEKADDNMRANYVRGRISFYDKEDQSVEKSLQKAIELPANKTGSTYLPSWGKAEAYELLVQFYLKESRNDEAGQVLNTALELFPDNYQLSVLVNKVKTASGKE
jgi:tetratricopeptide (TPR) repeat protein